MSTCTLALEVVETVVENVTSDELYLLSLLLPLVSDDHVSDLLLEEESVCLWEVRLRSHEHLRLRTCSSCDNELGACRNCDAASTLRVEGNELHVLVIIAYDIEREITVNGCTVCCVAIHARNEYL